MTEKILIVLKKINSFDTVTCFFVKLKDESVTITYARDWKQVVYLVDIQNFEEFSYDWCKNLPRVGVAYCDIPSEKLVL